MRENLKLKNNKQGFNSLMNTFTDNILGRSGNHAINMTLTPVIAKELT
jgi:hypothetical protein